MGIRRIHKPDDTYNCLCRACVNASLKRMGLPIIKEDPHTDTSCKRER